MTREDIIRMAREVGFQEQISLTQFVRLARFAALVAAHERETCAKLVEDKFDFCGDELIAADAIRKRVEAKS